MRGSAHDSLTRVWVSVAPHRRDHPGDRRDAWPSYRPKYAAVIVSRL